MKPVLALLCLLLLVQPAAAEPSAASARAFMTAAVARLNATNGPDVGVPLTNDWYDQSLADLMSENLQLLQAAGIARDPEFDWLCQCLEHGHHYRLVSVIHDGPSTTARAMLEHKNPDGTNRRLYAVTLRPVGGDWRIADIGIPNPPPNTTGNTSGIRQIRAFLAHRNACFRGGFPPNFCIAEQ